MIEGSNIEGSNIEGSNKESNSFRAEALQLWFREISPSLPVDTQADNFSIKLIQGDASFRRYFRAENANLSYILVDSPPDKEDNLAFVRVAEAFATKGVQVPHVYNVDYAQGFMCLSDFGDVILWEKLNDAQNTNDVELASELYRQAFQELLKIQKVSAENKIPEYTAELLMDEMKLFQDWFCKDLLGLELKPKDYALLQSSFAFLQTQIRSQTTCCVHRDYHSRNLIYCNNDSIGVIDFQDAVIGPLTYDLVSLLKDCYIAWPEEAVQALALEYFKLASDEKILSVTSQKFSQDFELMGVQRHLKAIGIFARLYLRDQKQNYLYDIPRTFSYLIAVLDKYEDLKKFAAWLKGKNVEALFENTLLRINGDHNNRDSLTEGKAESL